MVEEAGPRVVRTYPGRNRTWVILKIGLMGKVYEQN